MLAKMFNIGTLDSMGLLNRVVRDTATDIHTVKKLGSLVQQLGGVLGRLWFCNIEMMKRILNLDKTCMLLDGGNGNRGGRPTVTY